MSASAFLRAAPPRRRRRTRPAGRARRWAGAVRILVAVLLVSLMARTFVVMPRTIPTESMMPALVPGDYVLVAKWPYGWSRYSLPVAPRWPAGRLAGRLPARGDVVVFRAPGRTVDYVKRVIGLPGDTVAMAGGRLILNGRAVPRAAAADFVLRVGEDGCRGIAAPPYGRTGATCRLPRFRETLPGGRSYDVIDQGATMQDDMAPATVPPGRLFLLGDDRDMSEDSRFPVAAGGIGFVPVNALEGRVDAILASSGRGWRGILGGRIG